MHTEIIVGCEQSTNTMTVSRDAERERCKLNNAGYFQRGNLVLKWLKMIQYYSIMMNNNVPIDPRYDNDDDIIFNDYDNDIIFPSRYNSLYCLCILNTLALINIYYCTICTIASARVYNT